MPIRIEMPCRETRPPRLSAGTFPSERQMPCHCVNGLRHHRRSRGAFFPISRQGATAERARKFVQILSGTTCCRLRRRASADRQRDKWKCRNDTRHGGAAWDGRARSPPCHPEQIRTQTHDVTGERSSPPPSFTSTVTMPFPAATDWRRAFRL